MDRKRTCQIYIGVNMEDDKFVEMETVQKALEKYVPDHDKILELLDFSSKTRCEITAETIAAIQEKFPAEPHFNDYDHTGNESESQKMDTNFRDYVGNRGFGFNHGYFQAVKDMEHTWENLKEVLNLKRVRVNNQLIDQMFHLLITNHALIRDRMNVGIDYDSEEKQLKTTSFSKENLEVW